MIAVDLATVMADLGIALPFQNPGSYRVPCPHCRKGPRDDALGVTIDDYDGLVAHCFRCAWSASWRPRQNARQGTPQRWLEPVPITAPKDWSPEADAIWRRGEPIAGSVVEVYLKARNCAAPIDGDLRFLRPNSRNPWPRLMARITDAVTAAPISLHFTSLAPDGSGKAPVRRTRLLMPAHRKQGGVVRLAEDAEVQSGLGVAEGIETSLSVIASGWSPVWCAIDAGNIAALPVLPGIEALTVFADADAAGLKAAKACQQRWRAAGRECVIAAPPASGTDWNDLWPGVVNG